MNQNLKLGIVLLLIVSAITYIQLQQPNIRLEQALPVSSSPIGPPPYCTAPSPAKNTPFAPDLAGIAGYLNSPPLTLSEFIGKKVILIDFWTYSCINCQRTLPYLTAWHKKYGNAGLQIIGVHSPEFAFEEKLANVARAVQKFSITYPVVLDNSHSTWTAWQNRYWPAKYLIDIDGRISWYHFGEGNYEEAEKKIQELLRERAERLCINAENMSMTNSIVTSVDFRAIKTPEIYLGYEFTRGNFGNNEGIVPDKTLEYTLPTVFRLNNVYLQGIWHAEKDHIRLTSAQGTVVLKYNAKNVNIVAASSSSDLQVELDQLLLNTIHVQPEDLYALVNGTTYGEHTLVININGTGFQLYTFTFG